MQFKWVSNEKWKERKSNWNYRMKVNEKKKKRSKLSTTINKWWWLTEDEEEYDKNMN